MRSPKPQKNLGYVPAKRGPSVVTLRPKHHPHSSTFLKCNVPQVLPLSEPRQIHTVAGAARLFLNVRALLIPGKAVREVDSLPNSRAAW